MSLLECDKNAVTRLINVIPPLKNSRKESLTATAVLRLIGGEEGIRALVGLHPNGFQERLVMTDSIPLHAIPLHFAGRKTSPPPL